MTPVFIKDIYGDFWSQNQQLAIVTPFADFKKKKNSSNIMVAIFLIYDSKSYLKKMGMSTQEIIDDVNKNYLEDEDFDWEKYADIVEAYKDKCRSRLHKKVENMLDEIEQIEEARKNLVWDDPTEAKLKTELFDASKKLYNEAIDLQRKLNEEIAELELEGDYVPSMIEDFSL
jgi:type I site-specific restriction endonuclease